MSKMMSELYNLNEARKNKGNVIVEDNQENQEQVSVRREHKGIYFLSFLMVALIGLSAFSMSVSLKTFAQLERSLTDSKATHQILSEQAKDIVSLKTLVDAKSSEELSQISKVNDKISELNAVLKDREQELNELKIATNDLKTSLQDSVEELKDSDDLILRKFTLIDGKVNDVMKYNSTLLNTY